MSLLGSWGLALATLASSTSAFSIEGLTSELGLSEALMEGEPRVFFANYTSGLLAVNSTILLYALAAAGVVGAVMLALYLLANAPARSGYGSSYSEYEGGYARGFRSSSSGYDILTLISVASDLYGKLTYDDLDCQKKIICEFMDEPEMFGSGASKVKTGVQYAASWLAPLGFTIVDQISEAAMLDGQGSQDCEERFRQCEKISLKETVAEKAEEVRAVQKDLVTKETEEAAKEENKAEEYEYYYEEDEEATNSK